MSEYDSTAKKRFGSSKHVFALPCARCHTFFLLVCCSCFFFFLSHFLAGRHDVSEEMEAEQEAEAAAKKKKEAKKEDAFARIKRTVEPSVLKARYLTEVCTLCLSFRCRDNMQDSCLVPPLLRHLRSNLLCVCVLCGGGGLGELKGFGQVVMVLSLLCSCLARWMSIFVPPISLNAYNPA
jgi:hypothetical protein